VTSTTLNLDSTNYTTGYSYDAADRTASMTYPDTEVVAYTIGHKLRFARLCQIEQGG